MAGRRLVGGFGRRLRKARDAAGLSQAVVAERSGLSRTWVAEIELGIAEPRLTDAIAIANVLGEYGADVVTLLLGPGAGTVGEGARKSVDRSDHVRRAVRLPEGATVSLPSLDVERLSTS